MLAKYIHSTVVKEHNGDDEPYEGELYSNGCSDAPNSVLLTTCTSIRANILSQNHFICWAMLSKSVVCGHVLRQWRELWEPVSSVEGCCGTCVLIYVKWGRSGRTLLKIQEKVASKLVIIVIHITKSYISHCSNNWFVTTVTMNVRPARACYGVVKYSPGKYNYIATVQMSHYWSNSECFADILGTIRGTVVLGKN